MIKLVYCFRKRPDLTDAEFLNYWQNVHTPLGLAMPGIRRLVQSRTVRNAIDPFPPAFDAMVEIWFDDWAALARAQASKEWAASSADETNFVEPETAAYFITEEKIVQDAAK